MPSRPASSGRPLGPWSLVTAAEVAQEVGLPYPEAAALCARLPAVPGPRPRYLWRTVLLHLAPDVVDGDPAEEPPVVVQPRRGWALRRTG